MSSEQIKLACIGSNGSGKSTVCNYLKSKGFLCISLSDIVREVATQKRREHSRDNLILTANEIKDEYGLDFLASESIKKAENDMNTKVVFDSIRNPNEVNYLKKHNVHCIKISAPVELRYERISNRGHGTDHIDFETFKKQCEREESGESSGQHLTAAMDLCQHSIENAGDQHELFQQIENIITDIKRQP
jgi:dephospho-CoA kinase